ncbi:MAG: hypothetical protein ACE15C_05280 [Phycisphaerae bacterium]
MEDLEEACKLIGLEAKWLQPFDVEDPFNDQLRMEGFISQKPDHRYGGLAILRVGGRPAPQVVYGTPKLQYPFGRDGAFHFPPIRSIDLFEKLDGTNICAYRYLDADGSLRTTYKLRLYPVLRNGKWGPFLDMWREMIARYPSIPDLAARNDCSVSLELYGSRNTHLVVYEEPLAAALLFGIDRSGNPVSPLSLDPLGLPLARHWGHLDARCDPVAEYARIRAEMEAGMKHLDEGKLQGAEGTVWYVTRATGELVLFKCKPESVEAVHWAAGINKEAVTATCWNVFETQDTLTYETLLPLLQEEYSIEEIERFRMYIDDCIAEVNEQLAYRNRVLEAYRALGMSLAADKAGVMRALSKQFNKKDMKKVYTIVATYG